MGLWGVELGLGSNSMQRGLLESNNRVKQLVMEQIVSLELHHCISDR